MASSAGNFPSDHALEQYRSETLYAEEEGAQGFEMEPNLVYEAQTGQAITNVSGAATLTSAAPPVAMAPPTSTGPALRRTASNAPGAGGRPDFTKKLTAKVQEQARQLEGLTHQLQDAENYRHLIEERLLEVSPGHPLPVMPAHLGQKFRQPPTVPHHPEVKGIPAHRISEQAKATKDLRSAQKAAQHFENEHRVAEAKLADYVKRVKDMKTKVADLEKQLGQANRKLRYYQHGAQSGASAPPGLTGGDGGLNASVNPTLQEGTMSMIQRDVERGEAERKDLAAQLEAQSTANEEQRAYIEVLLNALEKKASEFGFSGPTDVVAEYSRLQDQYREAMSELTAFREGAGAPKNYRTIESEKAALLDYVQDAVNEKAQLTSETVLLKEQNAKVQGDLEALRSQVATLTTQAEEATARHDAELQMKRQEISEMQAMQTELLGAVRDATDQGNKVKSEYVALQATNMKNERAAQEATSEISNLKFMLKEATDRYTVVQTSLTDDMVKKEVHFKEQLSAKETTVSELRGQLEEAEAKARTLKNADDDNTSLRAQLASLKQELAEENLTSSKRRETLDTTTKQLESAQASLVKLGEVHAQKVELEQQVTELHDLLNQSETAKSALEDQLETIQRDKAIERRVTHDEIHQLHLREEALAKELAQTRESFQDSQSRLMASSVDKTNELYASLEQKSTALVALQAECSTNLRQLEQARQELQTLEAVQHRCAELEDQLTQAMSELGILRMKTSQQETQHNLYLEKIESFNSENQALKDATNTSGSELARYQEEVTALQATRKLLNDKIEAYAIANQALQQTVNDLSVKSERVDGLIAENTALRRGMSGMELERKEALRNVESSLVQQKDLQIIELTEKLEAMIQYQEDANLTCRQLTADKGQLMAQLDEAKATIAHLQVVIGEANQARGEMTAQLAGLVRDQHTVDRMQASVIPPTPGMGNATFNGNRTGIGLNTSLHATTVPNGADEEQRLYDHLALRSIVRKKQQELDDATSAYFDAEAKGIRAEQSRAELANSGGLLFDIENQPQPGGASVLNQSALNASALGHPVSASILAATSPVRTHTNHATSLRTASANASFIGAGPPPSFRSASPMGTGANGSQTGVSFSARPVSAPATPIASPARANARFTPVRNTFIPRTTPSKHPITNLTDSFLDEKLRKVQADFANIRTRMGTGEQ